MRKRILLLYIILLLYVLHLQILYYTDYRDRNFAEKNVSGD